MSRRFSWIFTVIVAGLTGCGGDDDGNAGPPDGGMVAPPEPTPGTTVEVLRPIVLTDRARLPEQDPELVDVEVMEDGLAFIYRSEVTRLPFAVDDVVAGIRHGGYLRRLTSVTQTAPTRIECATVHAELGELIGDGHFRVSYEPGTISDMPPSGEVGAHREPLTAGWSGISPESARGFACSATGGGTLQLRPRFDINVGMDVDLDIRWTSRFLIPRGQLAHALVVVRGELEVGATWNATNNLSASCMRNLLAGMMGLKLERGVAFAIGPVPVFMTHTIEPYAQISAGADVEVGRSSGSGMIRIGIRAGTEFDPAGGWRPIWEPTITGDVALTAERAGTLTASAAFGCGVKYSLKIYDTFGPAVSFGPNFTASFAATPECTWMTEVKSSLDLTGSLDFSVPFIDWQLGSFSVTGSFRESVIAREMGVFPWCDDAGPMTMPDAGPMMSDAGPLPLDAGPVAMDSGRPMTGSDAGPPDTGTADAGFRLPNGAPCTSRTQCRSFICVDGVCCNAGCTGVCQSCVARLSRAAADGICAAVPEDTDPEDDCPGVQTCQADSPDVTATAYCEAHYGDPCTGPGMCPDAGFCADGVCCNLSTCGGATGTAPCTSCRTAHTGAPEGICSAVVLGLDPYNYCGLPGSVCNGMNGCCLEAGTACTRASDCCSGACPAGTCS